MNLTLNLVTVEHSEHKALLRQKTAQIPFPLSPEIQQLIRAMKEKVMALGGVGLAAPQVGHALNLCVYVISEKAKLRRADAAETIPLTVLINASYEPLFGATEKKCDDWESCFSVTSTSKKVARYRRIKYTAQDELGNTIKGIAKGFTARVLQHEIDHLNGVLIIDL